VQAISIATCLAAALAGMAFGGAFCAYWLGPVWLKRTLADGDALAAFWSKTFARTGGVGGHLLAERPDWPKEDARLYMAAIVTEYRMFPRMRWLLGSAIVLLGGAAYWASFHTTPWVLRTFLAGLLFSVPFYPRSASRTALLSIFRVVRLWMRADPASLATYADAAHVAGVERVIQAMECTNSSSDNLASGNRPLTREEADSLRSALETGARDAEREGGRLWVHPALLDLVKEGEQSPDDGRERR
jgi:hypothetical protein